jgi:Spy/CpxP family protein refolding chaperone
MDSRKLRGMLVAIAASAMTMMAVDVVAQAPPAGGPPRGGMGGGAPMDKAGMTQRLALDDAALNLTADQKGKIDKILDAYIADQTKMRAQMTPGTPPSQEAMGAMRTAREKLNADVGAVLNDAQKKTWEASMAARRPAGPPGGGAGGPPPPR